MNLNDESKMTEINGMWVNLVENGLIMNLDWWGGGIDEWDNWIRSGIYRLTV